MFLLTPFAADADDAQTQAFVAEYQKRYGETPNQFAADGYDAAYILKAALQAAGCTSDMSSWSAVTPQTSRPPVPALNAWAIPSCTAVPPAQA